jgi:hypothetical protein
MVWWTIFTDTPTSLSNFRVPRVQNILFVVAIFLCASGLGRFPLSSQSYADVRSGSLFPYAIFRI